MIILLIIIYFVWKSSKKSEAEGVVRNYSQTGLREDAKIIDFRSKVVGGKGSNKFRVTVVFDDKFEYEKIVKGTREDNYRTWTYTLTLSREQQIEIMNEAIEKHNNALNSRVLSNYSTIRTTKRPTQQNIKKTNTIDHTMTEDTNKAEYSANEFNEYDRKSYNAKDAVKDIASIVNNEDLNSEKKTNEFKKSDEDSAEIVNDQSGQIKTVDKLYCSKCGSKLLPGAKYCSQCGKLV